MNKAKNLSRGILVSPEDEHLICKYLWSITEGRCTAQIDGKMVRLHRLIYPDSLMVDHKNHNQLDNRRSNLRVTTSSQNQCNRRLQSNSTSGYIGVTKHGTSWAAKIKVEGKTIRLGTFLTKEEAAFKRDIAAKKYHGEHAYLNFNLELT